MQPSARTKPLDENLREQLRELLQNLGERTTLTRVRLSRSALHRALAGLAVSEGTHAIVQRDLRQPPSAA
jgi:hypothetical protein